MKQSNVGLLCLMLAGLLAGWPAALHADAASGAAAGSVALPEAGRNLSLQEFLGEAVLTHPRVKEAHLQYLINCRQALAERGAFEPALTGRYSSDALDRENSSLQRVFQLGANTYSEKNQEYSLGVEGKFLTGATYRLGGSVTQMDNTYTDGGEYESFIGASAEQPLLKGATHGAPLAPLRLARQERFIAFHEYRRQLMDTISRAETAYWNLAFAREARRMAGDSAQISENLVRDAEERVKTGRMSDLDLRQAQAEHALRLVREADAEQTVRDGMTQLKLLLAGAKIAAEVRLVPTDPLISDPPAGWDEASERADSLAWARRAQPDYMILGEQVQRERIQLGYREDQVLPELILKGSYGLRGLGGTPQKSLEKIGGWSYPAWSLGLELRAPLLSGIRERNELEAVRLKNRLVEVRLEAMKYELVHTIEALLQHVWTQRSRIENLRQVAEVKRQLLDVELSRLEAGKSDIRQVYDAEEELSAARQEVLQSIVRYREARMELAVARGSVLRDQGLERLEGEQVVLAESLVRD